MLKFLLVAAFFIKGNLARTLWSADWYDINNVTLERGRPIIVHFNHKQVQICELEGEIYWDSFSRLEDVTALRICRSNIQKIETGALCAGRSLQTLELDFYGSKKALVLKKEHFENCGKLEVLLLKFDEEKSAYRIDHDTLADLPNLKQLYIQGYNLSHLQSDFLELPSSSLTTLDLSFGNIYEIDGDTFKNLTNLEEIEIVHNRNLTTIPKGLFNSTPKLKRLILRDNGIKDLTFDEFEGLEDLEELSLASNRIASFDADKLAKNVPNLKSLSIEQNPPRCKSSEAFANSLKSKLKHPIDIEYKFDPGYYDSCEEVD